MDKLREIVLYHMPKAGGTSLRTSLADLAAASGVALRILPHYHFTGYVRSAPAAALPRAPGRLRVTAIRDPVTRFVSAWNWLLTFESRTPSHLLFRDFVKQLSGGDLNAFILWPPFRARLLGARSYPSHFLPMHVLFGSRGNYDVLLRTETLQADLSAALGRQVAVPCSNRSSSTGARPADLSPAALSRLAELYARDFALFNYAPPHGRKA